MRALAQRLLIGHCALVEPGHRRRRPTPVTRTTCVLVLAALLSACSSSSGNSATPTSALPKPSALRVARPSSTTTSAPVVSNCGYLYAVHGLSDVVQIGGCAGSLSSEDATQARVSVGDVFQLVSVTDFDGSPEVQAPTSDNPDIVKRIESSNRGGDATYRALTPGTTTLRTSTSVCNGGPIDTTRPYQRICPVVQVTVEPTP